MIELNQNSINHYKGILATRWVWWENGKTEKTSSPNTQTHSCQYKESCREREDTKKDKKPILLNACQTNGIVVKYSLIV